MSWGKEAGRGKIMQGLEHHGKSLDFLQRTMEKPLKVFKQLDHFIWRGFLKDPLCGEWIIEEQEWSQE